MHEIWRRRAVLGAIGVEVGVILALSTLGAVTFGGPCATQICSVPGTEPLLVAGAISAVVGALVIAVSIRAMRRTGPTRK